MEETYTIVEAIPYAEQGAIWLYGVSFGAGITVMRFCIRLFRGASAENVEL